MTRVSEQVEVSREKRHPESSLWLPRKGTGEAG